MAATCAWAQVAEPEVGGVLKPIINTYPYTAQQDEAILKLFADARVSDVADALDTVGLPDTTIMTPDIQALWRDTKEFSHRIQGVAITARYVKTNRVVPRVPQAEYGKWAGPWYKTITPDAWTQQIRPGMIAVLDKAEDGDTRNIGSANFMDWKLRGLRGIVTNGGAGDTDEIIAERLPLYQKRLERGFPPGRSEIESVNLPVMVGNVLVRPGDIIVADGDGVVVVPRQHAAAVGERARRILEGDKKARRKLYEKLGLPLDKSVLP
jgi:regulator of RNase E activity RraA